MAQGNASVEPRRQRIGELLVKGGLISQEQLVEALRMQREQGGKTIENLIALHYLTVTDFVRFVARQPGIASIDVLNYAIPREVIDLVPAEFAMRHEILPIDKMGSRLTVGMVCPLDDATIGELETMTGLRVRPLLVSMHDLQAALRNYYPVTEQQSRGLSLEDVDALRRHGARGAAHPPERAVSQAESALTFEQVLRLVRKVNSLPALPETVGRVRAAVEDPESTVADVAAIIEQDPGLAAKCIGLANSPAFGFIHHVEAVDRAVSLLGMREVYGLVLSTAVIEYFGREGDFDYRGFWRRSRACANVAMALTRELGMKDRGGAFASGLLHDIGRVVMAQVLKRRYTELPADLADAERIAEENRRFGVAHPEVGFILAESWGLPPEIAEAIRLHHDVPHAALAPRRVATVALAAHAVDACLRAEGASPDVGELMAACPDALAVLELNEGRLLDLLPRFCEAVGQAVAD